MIRLHALDVKLLRDFRRLWAQALAIALVLGCGVAIFITAFGMFRSLDATRTDYYSQHRFADVFASARRAPLSLADEIRVIDGVWAIEPRVAGDVVLDLPGRMKAALGRVISLPDAREPSVNLPLLVSGRWPEAGIEGEVAVNAPFAAANDFGIGDSFLANLAGRRRELTVTGTFLSPEFIYTLPPGGIMPDNAGFGVILMPERAAAAAFGLTGAFNDLALRLRRGADRAAIIDRVDALLAPYGGLGGYDRDQQISHAFVDAEIQQLRSMALVLPPVFFGIAAFLVNMVLGRIIALERSEIGLLKAIGYRNGEIALHYLMLAGLVAVAGIATGWIAGAWMSQGLAQLYARFYDFPWLIRPASLDVYAGAALIGLASAAIGAGRAALQAAALAPAVAMAPPAPMRFRRSLIDRIARRARLSQPGMMILRSLTRWPVRSGLTVIGLGFGVAVLVAATFFNASLDRVMEIAFSASNRQHAIVVMSGDAPLSVVADAAALPGVLEAEAQHDQPAILRFGPREKRSAITARGPDANLGRLLDADGRLVTVPGHGVLLSRQLADHLGAGPGDLIEAEVIGRRAGTIELHVAGIVTQYMGIGAYMDRDALARALREAPRVTSVNLTLDTDELAGFHAAVKDLPRVASVVMLTDVRRSFAETIRSNIVIMTTVYVTMAVLITVGLAYNGARIQLSERARELASLRILGFTRAEVSYVLLGETAALALAAQPVGWLIGAGIAWSMVHGFESDLYRIPLVLTPAMFATASLISLGATLAAALLVRRRLDRADLVAVMKTRE